ncbi:uncharacterized protein [Amphiura filiformis]|uniref:uncharacterized protein n=1 Tax=Amphiura filiformis TaxID=82378 RepID=UPI003B222CCF
MSDHEAVTANCETNVQTNKKKPRTVHIYKKANLKGIEEDLQDFSNNFHSSTEEKTCSDNWECFKEALQDAMNKHIPTKRLSGRWNLPWMNNNIKHLMKKRRRRYDAWKKFGDKNDLADYKNLKQEVETALKRAHDEYIEGVFEEDTGNPAKKLWSYVKSLKIDKIGIPPLLYKNRLVSQPKQKAEALSEQYRSVFTSESTSHLPSKGPSKHDTMPDIEITTNGIEKLLTALNPKKAVGPDQVSTWMLKTFASTLAPILKEIFTQSLRTGDVPADWKLANISAIFKKGERNDPANYCPVSLTSVTCKLMEHVLASSIRGYLDDNNILSTSQHGFRKKHSCETQLLGTVEDLTRSLDNREQMDCLILDFSKAFDAVPHQRLLYKLNWYGIRGQTHTWIKNWLTSRKQTVVIEGEKSEEVDVISGVPQGTVLGPLLFILFVNDIGEETSSTIRLFADDALIYRHISSKADTDALQNDLHKLVDWSTKWQMRFNPAKCSLLRVAKIKKIINSSYTMLGTELKSTDHHPYLGVELASSMDWKHHIQNVSGKAQRTLNFLQRNLYKCPQKQRRLASRLTLFYKIHNQEVSVQIPCHYIPQDTPSIKTRRTHEQQYKIIRARTEVYKNSYFPATIPVWNKLPASIVNSTSSQTFKTKIQQLVSSDQSELCVDASQRSFALGLQSLIIRGVGLIPGPIVYGSLIDDSCLIWEQSCSGGWTCWMFDNRTLSNITVMLGTGVRFGSILFIFLAILFYYKPKEPKKVKHTPKSKLLDDDGVPSEQKQPENVHYSSVGVQASFPTGITKERHC